MYVMLASPIAWPLNVGPGCIYGLGDVQTGEQITSAAASAAAIAASVALPASAVPIVGPIIAGVALAVGLIIKNSGCGITCVETSQLANQAAVLLGQNIAGYFALPAPRTEIQQAAALANFDAVWAQLRNVCGQAGTGNAGVRCISDRQSGACTWKQTADKVPPWGTPAAGECWNWFNGYRDPIADDAVVPDTVVSAATGTLAQAITGATGSAALGSSLSGPLLIGALVLVGLVLVMN